MNKTNTNLNKIALVLIYGISVGLYAQEQSDTLCIENSDSTEYELTVFDPGYESFLLMQHPKEYYSESYYKHWNSQYVIAWNYRYNTAMDPNMYETYIEYDPSIKYGIDLEYRLYYYFRFFETSNNVQLIPGRKQ